MKRKTFLILMLILSATGMATTYADEIHLKNGDRMTGRVITMEDDKLVIKTSYAGEITVKWSEISTLKTDDAIQVILSDETSLKGATKPAENGKMKMKMGKIVETVSFDLAAVRSINPKPKALEPAVKIKGHINAGLTTAKGNSDMATHHLDGEFVARTKKNRYTIGAEFNRSEDKGDKTANNALGSVKYDHFLSKKWFLYSNASFEKDEFKDLNLRTALGVGAGYQFLETESTNLSLETGLAYVNTDYDQGTDSSYPAGRWSVNFDRYFFDKIVQFFHFHEGFVGFEDTNDIFIRSRTGLRLPIYKKFNVTAQYNLDWDKSPKPGREKTDEIYLLTLGYQW
ncbi:MAG: DUF481 domain-containing protein [Pseudomonadota bacterium]